MGKQWEGGRAASHAQAVQMQSSATAFWPPPALLPPQNARRPFRHRYCCCLPARTAPTSPTAPAGPTAAVAPALAPAHTTRRTPQRSRSRWPKPCGVTRAQPHPRPGQGQQGQEPRRRRHQGQEQRRRRQRWRSASHGCGRRSCRRGRCGRSRLPPSRSHRRPYQLPARLHNPPTPAPRRRPSPRHHNHCHSSSRHPVPPAPPPPALPTTRCWTARPHPPPRRSASLGWLWAAPSTACTRGTSCCWLPRRWWRSGSCSWALRVGAGLGWEGAEGLAVHEGWVWVPGCFEGRRAIAV